MAIENKSLAILVVVNVISLVVIAWLVGLLMGRQDAPIVGDAAAPANSAAALDTAPVSAPAPQNPAPAAPRVVQAPVPESQAPDTMATPATTEPGAPTTNPVVAETEPAEPAMSLGELIEQELGAPEENGEAAAAALDTGPQLTNVDIIYDGDIIRMEERDETGQVTVSISNSFRDAMKLAQHDAAYLQALEELKRKPRGRVSLQTVTQREARAVKARPEPAPVEPVDHINKVVVEEDKLQALESELKSLAEKIDSIVAEQEQEPAKPAPADAAYARASVDDYVKTLEVAVKERRNETRMIRVKPGDSLWTIARRAYGDGFQYPRIFKANPHLTDPDMIRVGDLLRVPL